MEKDNDLLLCSLQNDKDILLARLRSIALRLDEVLLLADNRDSIESTILKVSLNEMRKYAEENLPL